METVKHLGKRLHGLIFLIRKNISPVHMNKGFFLKIQHFSISMHFWKGWITVVEQYRSLVFSCKTKKEHETAVKVLRWNDAEETWDLEEMHIFTILQVRPFCPLFLTPRVKQTNKQTKKGKKTLQHFILKKCSKKHSLHSKKILKKLKSHFQIRPNNSVCLYVQS